MFLYRIIKENNLQCTFPNVEVVLRRYIFSFGGVQL